MDLPIAWQQANAAAALECCRAIGRVPQEGVRVDVALSAMRGQERSLSGGGVLIEDCYNANPLAMEAALRDLARRSPRRVAVLADMMELGPDEERYHREVARLAVELGIDSLIGVGERARWYVAEANGLASAHFADVQSAIDGISEHLGSGDTILLKGSRSMELERLGAVLD
jgi:UDP-N-acetylmuramoyl-tripeptide--D-alanyl-D-alanine ligase